MPGPATGYPPGKPVQTNDLTRQRLIPAGVLVAVHSLPVVQAGCPDTAPTEHTDPDAQIAGRIGVPATVI